MPDLKNLQSILNYQFKDETLLRLALTHPSVGQEKHSPGEHNQRLEFLGDAVLGLVLAHELFKKFPDFNEGPLTKARAQMVKSQTLAEQARLIDLGRHLVVSRAEDSMGGRCKPAALADAFEAVLGAIFLDGGFEAARCVILQQFKAVLDEIECSDSLENPKSILQEMLQTRSPEPPVYDLASSSGPDHDRRFECVVLHAGAELGRGTGKSKKEAEIAAASAALQKLDGAT